MEGMEGLEGMEGMKHKVSGGVKNESSSGIDLVHTDPPTHHTHLGGALRDLGFEFGAAGLEVLRVVLALK